MWWNKYVGMEWKEGGRDSSGYDCWGLVRAILKEQTNIELPRLEHIAYRNGGDKRALLNAIREYSESITKDEWKQLTFDKEKCIYDVIWLRNGGPIHFGVMIDNKRFIHVEEGCDSVIESVDSPRWSKKIRGIFRHKSRI